MARPALVLGCVIGFLLTQSSLAAAAPAPLPSVKHVFVIVLENESEAATFGPGSKAPYLARTLPSQGEFLPNYYAIGHVSLDNYVALISGQAPNADTQADCQLYQDVTPGTLAPDGQAIGEGCVYPATAKTVADQFVAKGLSWRGYMEDMGNSPSAAKTCRHPALNSPDATQTARNGDQYATRHNPFVYFHSLIDSPICQTSDVPLDRLPADLAASGTTPAYSFITPNLCHDGHDSPCVDGEPGGLVSADAFLRNWVPRITGSAAFQDGGLLAVVFDEASNSDSSSCCGEQPGPGSPNPGGTTPGPGGGRVGAVLLSPFIQPGTVNQTPYNHYSLLRSVEDLYGLDHLGYAGQSGLKSFGADVYNRAAVNPRAGPGPSGAGARPQIRITGVPHGCVHSDFTAGISVSTHGGVRRIVVTLGRRQIAATRRSPLRVRIRVSGLSGGGGPLAVRAVDRSGRTTTLTRTLRRCAPLVARSPQFTG